MAFRCVPGPAGENSACQIFQSGQRGSVLLPHTLLCGKEGEERTEILHPFFNASLSAVALAGMFSN